VVIDIDNSEIAQKLLGDIQIPDGVTICYRGDRDPQKILEWKERGHIYFLRPPWFERTRRLPSLGIELRSGPGAQVAVPPSVHPDGSQYQWFGFENFRNLPEFPLELFEKIMSRVPPKEKTDIKTRKKAKEKGGQIQIVCTTEKEATPLFFRWKEILDQCLVSERKFSCVPGEYTEEGEIVAEGLLYRGFCLQPENHTTPNHCGEFVVHLSYSGDIRKHCHHSHCADIWKIPLSELLHIELPEDLFDEITKKKIRKIPAQPDTTEYLSISQVHREIQKALEENLRCRKKNKNLLIKSPPGTQKTISAIKFCTERKRRNRSHQFIYTVLRNDAIQELQKKGLLPESEWRVIRARTPMDQENGNCYFAKELMEKYKNRQHERVKFFCMTKCPHYRKCKQDCDMYIGQWSTKKNLIMTHEMSALAGSRIKYCTRIFIDEVPLNSFMEKITVPESVLKRAAREVWNIPDLQEKQAGRIFKGIVSIFSDLRRAGEYITIAGNEIIAKIKDYLKTPPLNFELADLLEEVNIPEDSSYVWRKEFLQLLTEEVKRYETYGLNYDSNFYIQYMDKFDKCELYFRKKRNFNINAGGVVALDATTHWSIWEAVIDVEFEERKINVRLPAESEVVQVYTGRYGLNYHRKNPTFISKLRKIAAYLDDGKTFFVGWLEFRDQIGIKNAGENFRGFYQSRGSNRFANYNRVVVFGTPNLPPSELLEQVRCLFSDDGKSIDYTVEKIPRRYGMNTGDGNDYETDVPVASDPRLDALWGVYREQEILQCINRIRPLLRAKTIIIVGNIPIPGFPPTRLFSLSEFLQYLRQWKSSLTNRTTCQPTCYRTQTAEKPCTISYFDQIRNFVHTRIWSFEIWKNFRTSIEKVLKFGGWCQVPQCYKWNINYLYIIANWNLGRTAEPRQFFNTSSLDVPKTKKQLYVEYQKFVSEYGLSSQKVTLKCDGSPPKNIAVHYSAEVFGDIYPEMVGEYYAAFMKAAAEDRVMEFMIPEIIDEGGD